MGEVVSPYRVDGFIFLVWRWSRVIGFFPILMCQHNALFFALFGRVSFLCLYKEKSQKERIPDMPALREPCEARMNRRDVKLASAQTVTSRNPRLILCFSAGLNGRVKVKSKDE